MYCKKCGGELDDNLLCSKCGFQNSIEIEANDNIYTPKQPGVKLEPILSTEHITRKKNKMWAILSGIMFGISIIPFYKGYDKMTNYYSSDSYSILNKNAYVGGDAYNYIINAGYATAFFVLAVGFALVGVGFLIVYYLSDEGK